MNIAIKSLTLATSFVIIHTIKSESAMPSSETSCSSFRTFPECISFCRAAGKSERLSSTFDFKSPTYMCKNKNGT
jgi:hypothetical protein